MFTSSTTHHIKIFSKNIFIMALTLIIVIYKQPSNDIFRILIIKL